MLRIGLGVKYLAAFAPARGDAVWEIPVKLREFLGGSEGRLALRADSVTYYSPERGASRTWTLDDIESVSSGDRYEITLHTLERDGWTRGPRDYRFQLKQPILERQYEQLWRALNKQKSISFLKEAQQ
jgi:hypothetical protein